MQECSTATWTRGTPFDARERHTLFQILTGAEELNQIGARLTQKPDWDQVLGLEPASRSYDQMCDLLRLEIDDDVRGAAVLAICTAHVRTCWDFDHLSFLRY
jgi:hypothetical protein